MNALKEWLQELALIIGMYLVLAWTGLHVQWYHAVIIGIAGLIYGIMQGRRAIRFYRRKVGIHATLTAEEFDKWLIKHGKSPADVLGARNGESN